MKTMTCKQLGGACDQEFKAETWNDMKQQSMQHGMEMMQQGDQAHLQAGQAMKEKMQDSQAMQEWMEQKKKEFDELPRV